MNCLNFIIELNVLNYYPYSDPNITKILKFLQIFGKKWDNFIEENNIISSLAFKTKMIEFNTKFFETNKPKKKNIQFSKKTKTLVELKLDNKYFISL